MISFVVDYWNTVLPTVVAGVFLLRAMKKLHDEKVAEKAMAPALVAARRR